MSIVDFTADLFHDSASLHAFVDDPTQALRAAGFPDATPEQVIEILPTVAESMPPDHPLQAVVHAPDPQAALAELNLDHAVEDLESDAHLQGKAKAEGEMDSGLAVGHHAEGDVDADGAGDRIVIVETEHEDKGLCEATDVDEDSLQADFIRIVDDPSTPEIEAEIEAPNEDHAVDRDVDDRIDDPVEGHLAWGKAID
jgi:hypothetical protein